MNLRIFKTYSKYKETSYISIHFIPNISYEGFYPGDNCIFIGWLVWGIQIKW